MSTITITPDLGLPASPAPRRAWYRRPVIRAAAILAATAIAATLVFTGSTPAGPAGILAKDGYTSMQTWDKTQVGTLFGASGSDSAMLKQYVTGAAVGSKGSDEEAVIGLTPQGTQLFTSLLPTIGGSIGHGATVHMDGNNLVVDGTASSFGSSNG
jgi:hypothetical protein